MKLRNQYEKFNFFASDAIEYINDLLGLTKKEVYKNYYCKQERKYRLIARLILEYGQVYSYGRGGKTIAPRNLMKRDYIIQYDYNEIKEKNAKLFDESFYVMIVTNVYQVASNMLIEDDGSPLDVNKYLIENIYQ
jgi:hypothetical protein